MLEKRREQMLKFRCDRKGSEAKRNGNFVEYFIERNFLEDAAKPLAADGKVVSLPCSYTTKNFLRHKIFLPSLSSFSFPFAVFLHNSQWWGMKEIERLFFLSHSEENLISFSRPVVVICSSAKAFITAIAQVVRGKRIKEKLLLAIKIWASYKNLGQRLGENFHAVFVTNRVRKFHFDEAWNWFFFRGRRKKSELLIER